MNYEKLERDGKVAVIVSGGFGAGWSTWASEYEAAEAMLFDKRLAEAIDEGDSKRIEAVAEELFPEEYKGGLEDCYLTWLDKGTQFYIDEYDGAESVVTAERMSYVA